MFQSSQVSQFRSECLINRFYCLAVKLGRAVRYFHADKNIGNRLFLYFATETPKLC